MAKRFEKMAQQVDPVIRAKWEKEQNELRDRLIEEDQFYFPTWANGAGTVPQLNSFKLEKTLKLIGSVDISYSKTDDRKAVAAIIVMTYPDFKVVYEDYQAEIQVNYPYIPGFLAFKEVPLYKILFTRLQVSKPELWPQVLLVDGNGILHTRMFGAASHIGVQFDLPTIGCAKKTFDVDGLNKPYIKSLEDGNLPTAGSYVNLVGTSGRIWGASLRTTQESTNPIYVSVSHRICLETAVKIVKMTITNQRIPEPIH